MKYDSGVISKMLNTAATQLASSSLDEQLAILRTISSTCSAAADDLELRIDIQLDDIYNTQDLK